jgi:hypothetical protein
MHTTAVIVMRTLVIMQAAIAMGHVLAPGSAAPRFTSIRNFG